MRSIQDARKRIRPFVERARGFSGWRLDEFAPKAIDPAEPWSYRDRAAELLGGARIVLDMGTGGGEVFEEVLFAYRGRAVATESWSVNAPVATSRLRPYGVHVVQCNSLRLPFKESSFDVVLNRNEELDPAEVARVLAGGGHVLTEQMGRNRWKELRPFFPRMQDPGDLLQRYESGSEARGLTVVQARSHERKAAYRGIGEVAFLLCIAPWEISGFDPLGRDLPALLDAEESLMTDRGIVLTESVFLLEARKPTGTPR